MVQVKPGVRVHQCVRGSATATTAATATASSPTAAATATTSAAARAPVTRATAADTPPPTARGGRRPGARAALGPGPLGVPGELRHRRFFRSPLLHEVHDRPRHSNRDQHQREPDEKVRHRHGVPQLGISGTSTATTGSAATTATRAAPATRNARVRTGAAPAVVVATTPAGITGGARHPVLPARRAPTLRPTGALDCDDDQHDAHGHDRDQRGQDEQRDQNLHARSVSTAGPTLNCVRIR